MLLLILKINSYHQDVSVCLQYNVLLRHLHAVQTFGIGHFAVLKEEHETDLPNSTQLRDTLSAHSIAYVVHTNFFGLPTQRLRRIL